MGGIAYLNVSVSAGLVHRSCEVLFLIPMSNLKIIGLWIGWVVCIVFLAWIGIKLLKTTAARLRERKATRTGPITDKSIQDILDGRYTEAGVGGGVVLAQMKIPQTKWMSIFVPIVDENSLVNFVLRGDIQIERVILDTLKEELKGQQFAVFIVLNNQSQEEINFNIPKGQVFENKSPEAFSQNLVASNDYKKVMISPNEKKNVQIEAYCLNINLPPPRSNIGNLTIFELRNRNFVNQAQLWKIVEKAAEKFDVESSI